jgi:hypothetical protein
MAAEALLDGEAQALTRKAIELALAGDTTALRLSLERIVPGSLLLDEGAALIGMLEAKRRAIETTEIEARLNALEARSAANGK